MRRFLVIFCTLTLLASVAPRSVSAATLSLSAADTTVNVGQTTTVSVIVRSTDQPMNASQAKVSFPTDKLQVTGVSKGSLFSYWTGEPAYSNGNGTVTFGGGLPSPGYKGTGRTIITITFKAKAEGKATVSYGSGSVLANDGEGTNILTSTSTVTITIAAAAASTPAPSTSSTPTPVVRSTTHPDPDAWYNANDATFTWTRPTGVQGVSYSLDQNAGTIPDEQLEDNSGERTYPNTVDGTWYFHLRAKYSSGWSSTAHVRVKIDTQPPESFTPKVSVISKAAPPTFRLEFQTTDGGSGVARYTLALDTQEFVTVTSPRTVETKQSGIHQFTLRAVDNAGNVREVVGQFNAEGSPAPRLTSVPKKLTLFADMPIEGLTVQGDTVILMIDGQEVARFASDAYRSSPTPGVFLSDGLTAWRFTFRPLLIPGDHLLTAKVINQARLESPSSVPVPFRTLGSTVLLFGFLVPSVGLVFGLLGIILLLLALLILLYERFRHWRRAESFDLTTAEDQINQEIDRLQASLEKDIVGAIRSSVTERSLQAATHEQIRKDITQVRQRIDELVDEQVKKMKKKKRK